MIRRLVMTFLYIFFLYLSLEAQTAPTLIIDFDNGCYKILKPSGMSNEDYQSFFLTSKDLPDGSKLDRRLMQGEDSCISELSPSMGFAGEAFRGGFGGLAAGTQTSEKGLMVMIPPFMGCPQNASYSLALSENLIKQGFGENYADSNYIRLHASHDAVFAIRTDDGFFQEQLNPNSNPSYSFFSRPDDDGANRDKTNIDNALGWLSSQFTNADLSSKDIKIYSFNAELEGLSQQRGGGFNAIIGNEQHIMLSNDCDNKEICRSSGIDHRLHELSHLYTPKVPYHHPISWFTVNQYNQERAKVEGYKFYLNQQKLLCDLKEGKKLLLDGPRGDGDCNHIRDLTFFQGMQRFETNKEDQCAYKFIAWLGADIFTILDKALKDKSKELEINPPLTFLDFINHVNSKKESFSNRNPPKQNISFTGGSFNLSRYCRRRGAPPPSSRSGGSGERGNGNVVQQSMQNDFINYLDDKDLKRGTDTKKQELINVFNRILNTKLSELKNDEAFTNYINSDTCSSYPIDSCCKDHINPKACFEEVKNNQNYCKAAARPPRRGSPSQDNSSRGRM